jgi:phosphonate degradation associated HDIG domain protein
MTNPPALDTLPALHALLRVRGNERYDGEDVSHLEHALQCATLARRAGAAPTLIVAALLHDIGHLAHGLPGTPSAAGHDDRHEALGAALLAPLFGDAVAEPVRLHVEAKRCLAMNAAYRRVLSADSQRSLALQGGPLDEAGRAAFLARPFAAEALRLRHWDDAGKSPRLDVPPLAHWWALAERVGAEHAAARAAAGAVAER